MSDDEARKLLADQGVVAGFRPDELDHPAIVAPRAILRAIQAAVEQERERWNANPRWGDVPLVPSLWPLGERAVLIGLAIVEDVGMVVFRPVTDPYIGAADDKRQEAWDAASAMQLVLSYRGAARPDGLIEQLQELKRQMDEAAAIRTIGHD